jgi:2-polyprenyl-6-methoxyphenol hydroxylase-like FAD-dependent oxidoreductase
MNADVVVVGGGPAGSVTAMLLAQHGLHVVLLEKFGFPRAKPCGDCLSPAANRILKRIGVWDAILRLEPAQLRGWKLTSAGSVAFTAHFSDVTTHPDEQCSLAIERSSFDTVLLDAAREAGVVVVEHARVIDLLHSDDRVTGVTAQVAGVTKTFNAQLTVGADGLRSVVARRMNAYARPPRLRKTSFTMHVERDETNDLGEMRVARNACLGIAPVGGGSKRTNFTLVLNRGSFDARAGARQIVDQGLAVFGIALPQAARGEILASGPFDWPVNQMVAAGVALVGDAAGYYDPFTGQGIYQALAGAELLAEAVSSGLRRSTLARIELHSYAAAYKRLTSPVRRVQRAVEYVCARPRLGDWMFAKFARDPVLARALVGITGDLVPPNSLFSPRLLLRLST